MALRPLPDCVTLGQRYGLWMEGEIAAFARREGEGIVGVRSQALTLVSLVLSRFFSHCFRGSGPVPESPPLLRVGIWHQAINLSPFMLFREILRNRDAFGVHK